VKFKTSPRFDNDWKALPKEHRKRFRELMGAFNAGCEAYIADPGGFIWPASLRVAPMVSARGIWEMTWSFTGPDGRATFEFTRIDGESGVLWRRIGGHGVFARP